MTQKTQPVPGGKTAWASPCDGGTLLRLHVVPGASRTGPAGAHGDSLKIRIAARPTGGEANAELVAFLAKRLDVPKKSVSIWRGAHTREKLVRVDGVAEGPVRLALTNGTGGK